MAFVVPHGIKTTPSILGIGFTDSINQARCRAVRRIGYTIHFVLRGKGFFNGNPVNKGQGFLVYDGMIVGHQANKNDPWALMWITFSDDSAKTLFDGYNADPVTGIFDYDMPILVNETARKVLSYKSGSVDSLELLDIFLKLHFNCMKKNDTIHTGRASELYIESALKYIKDHVHNAVSIDELTEFLGISQPYLYRLFKNEFNMSPKQYIMQYKLNVAKNMLANTDLSVSEIANVVGYTDPLAFSKMFSTKEKTSPQKFRNGKA